MFRMQVNVNKDKAFSPTYKSDPTPPPPPSPVSKLEQRHTGRLRKRDNLLTVEEEKVGEEPFHTTTRKPGPL
jgi:hypothetical protein